MKLLSILVVGFFVFVGVHQLQKAEIHYDDFSMDNKQLTKLEERGMLLVLTAPSVHNDYYKDYFKEIVSFQVRYAQKILDTKYDHVRILVDDETRDYYSELPEEILVDVEMYDIWMRDFTTVNPHNPVQFVYTDASMSQKQSTITQNIFSDFADSMKIQRVFTDYIIDGGNIVDNYKGRVITTTRFLEDNEVSALEAKEILKNLLHAKEVAIIEPDDEVLAHADGMVAWIDDNVLAVNDYSKEDPVFHNQIMSELSSSFPGIKIITVPVVFDNEGGVDASVGIGSACGIHLNLVATHKHLYVPVFGVDEDADIVSLIQENTTKQVIPVNAENICLFGGSVRCTTWQLAHSVWES